MEILIRDPRTKLFLNDQALWVIEEAAARVFLLPLEGLKFCVEHGIAGVQLAFRYPKSRKPIEKEPPAGTGASGA